MTKRKHQEKIEELKNLMLRSNFWSIKEDALEVLDFHLANIEKQFEDGVTPRELMGRWPNW
jgi:uncharacterized protein YktA (UPF0223 family)